MGNGNFTKDPKVDMYIQLSKPYFYTCGQVTGNIIINFKKENCQYHALYIKVVGFENFMFDRNRKESFQQSKQIYKDQIVIHRFQQSILQGIYCFPFSFIAPISLPGSLVDKQYQNISYKLIGYLINYENKSSIQYEPIDLFLIQSSRSRLTPIQVSQQFNMGIISNRSLIARLSSDRNVVFNGQNIKLRVQIDNRNNSKDVHDIKFLFQQKRIKYADEKKQGVNETINEIPLNLLLARVKANEKKIFEFNVPIPKIRNSTAIGRTIAQYHQILMKIPNYCCFAKQITLFLIVQEQQSFLKATKKQIIPIDIRNAIIMPFIKYNNLAGHVGPNRNFPFVNPPTDHRALQRQQVNYYQINPEKVQKKLSQQKDQIDSGKYFQTNSVQYLNNL